MHTQTSINGQIYTCNSCSKIHLEYLSMGIDFENEQILTDFRIFLEQIDARFYEIKNINLQYRRKIVIPFPRTSIKMLLTAEEVEELRNLVTEFLQPSKTKRIVQKTIRFKMGPDFKKVQLN